MLFERYKRPDILKEGGMYRGEDEESGVDYTVEPKGLKITLGKNFDREELQSDIDQYGLGQVEQDFFDKYAGMIGNGFNLVAPEQVGALTDSIIIGEDVEIDDAGDFVNAEALYWYPNYQIKSFLEDLLEKGETFFDKAE